MAPEFIDFLQTASAGVQVCHEEAHAPGLLGHLIEGGGAGQEQSLLGILAFEVQTF
jgi:hypothetical protein